MLKTLISSSVQLVISVQEGHQNPSLAKITASPKPLMQKNVLYAQLDFSVRSLVFLRIAQEVIIAPTVQALT